MKKALIYFVCISINILLAQFKLSAQINSYPSSGNIGFGITAVDKLHVNGNIISEGYFYSGNPDALRLYSGHPSTASGNGQAYLILSAGGGYATLGTPYPWTGNLDLVTNGVSRMTFTGAGKVGIGISTPTESLDINGSTRISGQALNFAAGSPGLNLDMTNGGLARIYSVNGSGSTVIPLLFGVGGSETARIDPYGNFGIGTSTPPEKISIEGAARISGQSNNFNAGSAGVNIDMTNSGVGRIYSVRGAAGTDSPLSFGTANSEAMRITTGGNLCIGMTSSTSKLAVAGNAYINGNISANGYVTTKKVTVTQLGWSDYVFNDDYKLRSLLSLELFIKQNKHLPEVPTAKDVAEKGISVGDNQALLLKKIEELTLYVIAQQKQIDRLKNTF